MILESDLEDAECLRLAKKWPSEELKKQRSRPSPYQKSSPPSATFTPRPVDHTFRQALLNHHQQQTFRRTRRKEPTTYDL